MPLNIQQPRIPQAPNLLGMGGGTSQLANELARQKIAGQQQQNILAARGEQRAMAGEQRAGEAHEMTMQQKRFVLQHKIMAAMIADPNMEAEFGPDFKKEYGPYEIIRKGDTVKWTDENGIIEGPAKAVADNRMALAELRSEPGEPNREKFDAVYDDGLRKGVSFTAPEEEKAPKNPTTAMAKFIQDNPDATTEELISFTQALKGKGMKVTLPDGTVVSVGGGSDMTMKTKGALEEKITSGKEQYTRISQIISEFKPEYQEIGSRLGAAWTGIKAKLGQDVNDEDAKFLTEFKAYQRKAIENINLYIKEMTGAQMSEREANRLRLAQPDPGEKWYTGDDPITFKSKASDVLKYTRAAVARYEYYRAKGFSDQDTRKMINSGEATSLEEIVAVME